MARFCPSCWREIGGEKVCTWCGSDLEHYLLLPYEEQLIVALRHPNVEQRITVIRLLGCLKVEKALPEFKHILDTCPGYFLTREIIHALGAIGSLESLEMISQLFGSDPSHLITQIVENMKRERLAKRKEEASL